MKPAITSIIMLIGACTLLAEDNTKRFDKYGFSVDPPNGWHVCEPAIIKMLSAATHKGVVAHAKQKSPELDASVLDSEILLIITKHPIGAKEDNPNVTVSVEKAWNPTPRNTGRTYLELLQERFKLLAAPSRFVDEPQELKIGTALFHTQEAVNSKVPEAATRQQYITTYVNGFYLAFIISYNDKKDPDYKVMRAMAESFTVLKNDVQSVTR